MSAQRVCEDSRPDQHFTLPHTDYMEYFKTLNISDDSNEGTAREAFLKLAKIYHPDTGHKQADAGEFQKIEFAYRQLLEKFSQDRRNNDCEGEFGVYYEQKKKKEEDDDHQSTNKMYDIKHTAPQHRQYLNFEGIGLGTPSQREKQYSHFKAMRAAENIIDFQVQQLCQDTEETAMVAKQTKAARDVRTRYGIDRLVEDKIQESMARGDFDNLPNAGKPLKFQNHNPFVDVVTHKLNQVLIDNGYAPEWVMLEREIREDRAAIKEKLEKCRGHLGSSPLSLKDEVKWKAFLSSLVAEVDDLNKKIDKYNLVVPILKKQTVHFPLHQVADKVVKEGKNREAVEDRQTHTSHDDLNPSSANFKDFNLRTIINIFKGK